MNHSITHLYSTGDLGHQQVGGHSSWETGAFYVPSSQWASCTVQESGPFCGVIGSNVADVINKLFPLW